MYADITINVYIYIFRKYFLYLWGREPLTNRYMSKHEYMSLSETYLTNQTQTGLCPHKVELLLSHYIAMFYNRAINLAVYYIYEQSIHFYSMVVNRLISKYKIMYHILSYYSHAYVHVPPTNMSPIIN